MNNPDSKRAQEPAANRGGTWQSPLELLRAFAGPTTSPDSGATSPIRVVGGIRAAHLVWTLVAMVLMWQVVVGYFAFSKSTVREGQDNFAIAMKLLAASDLSGGAEYLRQELVKNPDNDQAYRELDALHTILSDPLFIAADDERLDEINLMLIMADEMARRKPGSWIGPDTASPAPRQPGIKGRVDKRVSPAASAFRIYTQFADSHKTRLERARLVQRIARAAIPASVRAPEAGQAKPEPAWFDAAVKWLEEEDLRRTAYGLQAGEPSAELAFQKMNPAERRVVARIRSALADSR